jgi:hypothetical protein
MQPPGRINPLLLAGLAIVTAVCLGASFWLLHHARAPVEATAGPWTLHETHRELTGQQRSTRVLFAEEGRMLAVICPRYNKVLLYDVTDTASLALKAEIALEGRPVAMASAGKHLVVLERPSGDDKHLGPGWWESFRFDGSRSGSRVPAGYYPDDLAVTPDGKFLLVLSSGQAEGDKKKPLPGLDIYEAKTAIDPRTPTPVGHLDLEPSDDGERLVVSATGKRALVTLPKRRQSVAMDLEKPEAPHIMGRIVLPGSGTPYVSVSDDGDWMIMPTMKGSEAVVLDHLQIRNCLGTPDPWNGYLLYTLPDESMLEVAQSPPQRVLGRFPIKGPLNLGGTRPSGLAFCPARGLAAVTTKPGTVHLVSIRSRVESGSGQRGDRIAANQGAMIKKASSQ